MSALDTDTTTRRIPSPAAILAVVGFSVFVAADDLTVVSTMLRPIIGDLGLVLPDGLDDAAWIVNAYLIAFVAVMPIAGRISDVLGRRRTFVGAYLLFLVGTTLIPLSIQFDEPFRWFLFGRVLTAIGGGAMVPVALAVVGDVYAEGKRARALGTLGAIETMGWVWGPLYGAMLVRFLSWEWQFWLNVPLALAGLAASWWALAGHDRPEHRQRVDWIGATLLTVALVSLNMALLGSAEIQSVNGLDELTGGTGPDLWWLYPLSALATGLFIVQQSYSANPLFDPRIFRGRNLLIALGVNFAVGAGLVIAMVDVPLFINSVELDLERAAVYAGWTLSSLTAAMALTSYLGGRATERWWYQPPVLLGLAMSTASYAWMGSTWTSDTSYPIFAVQLALLGGGFGLTVAPTTSAVVDAAPADQRGAAASVVMVVRLLGLSVGLSALTAWGLARFNDLRSTIDLPPITDPGFESAVVDAQERLTAQAIAETFTAAAVVLGAGLLASLAMRHRRSGSGSIASLPIASTTPEGDTL
jgi:MFS family permease